MTKILFRWLSLVGVAASFAAAPAPRTDRHGDPLPPGALARLGTIRWRAPAEFRDVAFSPDGKSVAAAAANAGIFLFDLQGRPIKRIRAESTWFERLAFSGDGRKLVCSCEVREPGFHGTALQVWDRASGRKTQQFDVKRKRVAWLGWSAEGKPLAVFAAPGAVIYRELGVSGEKRFEARDYRPNSTRLGSSCSFSVRARLLTICDGKGVIHAWDVSSGKKRATLETNGSGRNSLAVSPDGRMLAVLVRPRQGRRFVQLRDLTTGDVTHTLAADHRNLDSIAFSPDGKTLATAGHRDLRFYDVSTGVVRSRSKSAAQLAPEKLAFSSDGKKLTTMERSSRSLQLWDVATAAMHASAVAHTEAPTRVAFSPDGRRVATVGENDGRKIIWDSTSGASLLSRVQDAANSCDFSADGRVLVSCNNDDTLTFSDAATGRVLNTVKLEDPDRPDTEQMGLDLRLSRDRRTLVALCRGESTNPMARVKPNLLITALDMATRKRLFYRRRVEPAWHSVSPDARLLAIVPTLVKEEAGLELYGAVHLEDLATGEHLLSLPVKVKSRPCGFSADSRFLATYVRFPDSGSDENGSLLRLWELETAREILALPAQQDLGNLEVAFSPDGRLLAFVNPSGEIVVWDLHLGKERQRFVDLDGEVTCLVFSPNSRRLVSGLSNTSLLVWQVAAPPKGQNPAAPDTNSAWTDLAGEPRKAFAARWALAGSPERALPLLRERLKAVSPADPRLLRRLIANLDGDEYETRTRAQKELAKLGDRAREALLEELKNKPSLEAHRRIEGLLQALRPPFTEPDLLRSLRAIAVLEDIGTPQARKILETLAKGPAGARVTCEAKAILGRLARGAGPEQSQ
jgi:WD40 repeat protein